MGLDGGDESKGDAQWKEAKKRRDMCSRDSRAELPILHRRTAYLSVNCFGPFQVAKALFGIPI
jgi:hypothetical protein